VGARGEKEDAEAMWRVWDACEAGEVGLGVIAVGVLESD
jgi:hypothetical protein